VTSWNNSGVSSMKQGEPGLHEQIPIPAVYEHGNETKPIDTSVPCQNSEVVMTHPGRVHDEHSRVLANGLGEPFRPLLLD
jgi:hypothetical protein